MRTLTDEQVEAIMKHCPYKGNGWTVRDLFPPGLKDANAFIKAIGEKALELWHAESAVMQRWLDHRTACGCGVGTLKLTGVANYTDPLQHHYRCVKCGKEGLVGFMVLGSETPCFLSDDQPVPEPFNPVTFDAANIAQFLE